MNVAVQWLRTKLGIEHDQQVWASCRGIDRAAVADLCKIINEQLVVHADVHALHNVPDMIIVAGSYRHGDYVHVFTMPNNDFKSLVDMLHEHYGHSRVGRFDMPNRMSIEAFYPHKEF